MKPTKMIAAAVFVLLVASSAAAPVEPWWGNPEERAEYQCGGTQGGQYHSYLNDYNTYGNIRKVEVWAGLAIDAVRFTHGDATEGPKLGGTGGVLQGNFVLGAGDSITGVDIEKQTVEGVGEVICRITFVVNGSTRYGPYGDCRHDGTCGERTFTAPMKYVSLQYGAQIFRMTFTY